MKSILDWFLTIGYAALLGLMIVGYATTDVGWVRAAGRPIALALIASWVTSWILERRRIRQHWAEIDARQ